MVITRIGRDINACVWVRLYLRVWRCWCLCFLTGGFYEVEVRLGGNESDGFGVVTFSVFGVSLVVVFDIGL